MSLKVSGFAVSLGEATKPFLLEVVKVSKLEEVSHELLVATLPHVSSCLSGFPLASPIREATKPFLLEVVKVSKLEEVSHEMPVSRLPHVSS